MIGIAGRAWVAACLMTWDRPPARAGEAPEVLRDLAARLRPALAGLTPAAAMDFSAQPPSLVVSHQTRKFLVHGRTKSGEWSTNVMEQVGPAANGFILRVHLEPQGTVHQAVTPQTFHEPYWQTRLDVTTVAGTTNQVYWALSVGGRVDETVVTNLCRVMAGLAPSAPATAPVAPAGAR